MPNISLKDYQEDRLERGVYDRRNRLNDLTGKEWLFSTKTIIPKLYPSLIPTHLYDRSYRPIPITLCQELLTTFTKPNDTFLDPFAGVGSALIAGNYVNTNDNSSNRTVLGFCSEPYYLEQYRKLIEHLKIRNPENVAYKPLVNLKHLPDNSIDFILTDLLSQFTSVVPSLDFQINTVTEEILPKIVGTFKGCIPKLVENKHVVIAVPFWNVPLKDVINNLSEWNFALTTLLTKHLSSLGLILKAERFWFEPSNSIEDITLVDPQRRLLVFRKESIFVQDDPSHIQINDSKLPLGPTFMLHRSFPPSFEHKLRGQHGGMKPPELMEYLIRRYSKNKSDLILDPFVGVGGSLLGATLSHRKAIGIDINPQWYQVYSEVCQRMQLPEQTYIVGDSVQIVDETIEDDAAGMIMTDVPYWAMDKLRKTRGRYSKAGEAPKDKLHSSLKQFNQNEILTIQEWYKLLESVFHVSYNKLTPGKPLAVFIGNMYRTLTEIHANKRVKVGKFLLLSSAVANILLSLGYKFIEEIIWYAPDKSLHIFGYPYSYIPSVVHQSILIFKK